MGRRVVGARRQMYHHLTGEYDTGPLARSWRFETGLMALAQCIYSARTLEEEEAEGWDAKIVIWG